MLAAIQEMDNPQNKGETDYAVKQFKDGNQTMIDTIHKICSYYPQSEAYKNGTTTLTSYKICCELVDYCSFYKQTWFYIACGGAGLLIIIIVGVIISCCCCCKGRRGGGKDLEISESSEESTKDEQETD
ncbi:hypothetical protein B9Z55_008155 [Caenorhabditis nigoni]|nr:hypothetical protein B9Z55_008155 [Caenorhabditis nigoni]